MSRGWWWTILVVAGFAVIILAILIAPQKVAIAAAIGTVGSWIAFGFCSSWWLGLRRHVVKHLGPRWNLGEVLRHRIRTADRVNLQLALDWLQNQSGQIGPFGVRHIVNYEGEDETISYPNQQEIVPLLEGNPEPVAIVWEPYPTSTEETMHVANNALYFLRIRDEPICVLVQGRSGSTSKRGILQVLARTQNAARDSLNEILRLANEQSVYRGQVISLGRPKKDSTDLIVQFHEIRRVERGEIVLPKSVLEIIERNVLSFFRHAEVLRRVGQGTRHGVLLHGPPGTGKTLVTRYLATNVGATVILINGRQYAQLRPACQLARLLAPSLVILEDVDLIATDRRRNPHTPLLHELLDEMDGITAGADIVFLLTTNRPETLEPALASRPGRVDQAIYFPLPDLECRRLLFEQFRRGLNTEGVEFSSLLTRTAGASPAFLRELFRRATLLAIERGERSQPLLLQQSDFESALRELVETGGPLTRAFLGFPAPPS